MILQFVPGSDIGSVDRRLIRSHVMKGKNAGKSRTPRRAMIHRSTQPCSSPREKLTAYDEYALLETAQHITVEHLLWNDLIIASFPEQVSPDVTTFAYHRMMHLNYIPVPSSTNLLARNVDHIQSTIPTRVLSGCQSLAILMVHIRPRRRSMYTISPSTCSHTANKYPKTSTASLPYRPPSPTTTFADRESPVQHH